jgi:CRP-like cAMP-binding protein
MFFTFSGRVRSMRYYSRIVKKFKTGEIVFSENSECDGMYIIDSGRVRVFKSAGNGSTQRDLELCTLGPKAMFGEMAMIDENKRSASVQAMEPTVCTVITKKIFEDQLNRIPLWMVNMIKILVMRLRETNDKLRTIVEQYTPPPADSGSVITIDEDGPVIKRPADELKTSADDDSLKQFKSDEILKDLFK